MKIAIVGCGYIGSALAVRFKHDGHFVTTTTRTSSKVPSLQSISDKVCVLKGDDVQAIKELLHDQEVVVLCMAADSQESYEQTYLNTAEAVAAAMEHALKLKHVVYTSSTSVYGDHQGDVVDEKTPASALSVNGRILVETENILLGLSRNDRYVCILRLGEIYGPGRLIADRLSRMLAQGSKLPGNGSSITNLIHLDDIVGGINFALDRRLNGVYNLCNDIHMTRKELYTQICAEERLPPVKWDPDKISLHSGNKLVLNTKIKAAGFNFLTQLTHRERHLD